MANSLSKNSLSKKISIFPISFDRSQGSSYTMWELKNLPENPDENADLIKYLNNNLILLSQPDDKYISYYEEKPVGNPKETYANGRILSEKNIARLISALTDDDHKNFVVHADIPKEGANANKICNYIEFVIRGHYFAVDLLNNIDIGHKSGDNPYYANGLWVGVKFGDSYIINDPDNTDEYEQLFAYDKADDANTSDDSEDDYDVLAEVDFFNTAPNQTDGWNSTDYSEHLQLLEKLDDDTLRVPTASQFKFTSRSIKNINGGTV